MPGRFLRSFAFCLAVAAPVFPASAEIDAGKVGGALSAAIAATGRAKLTYDTAVASGDTVTLSGVTLTTLRNGYTVAAPALTMTGVAERSSGGYAVASATFDGGSATAAGDTIGWRTALLDGGLIPSEAEVKGGANLAIFRDVTLAGVTIAGKSLANPITAEQATATLADAAAGGQTEFTATASNVHLPTSLLAASFIGALVSQLDYKEFTADIKLQAVLDAAASTIELKAATLDAIGAGKISVSGRASGVALKDIIDSETSKEARANARFDTATLRLDNEGFVERLLELQASMLGYSLDDVRAAWVDGALPIALSVVKNEAFRTQFLAAVAAFLKQPKSLTLVFSPPAPVPLGQVMRTASHMPTALPDLLAPTVEANK